jgi:Mrp family chromosome partitioning ATPase
VLHVLTRGGAVRHASQLLGAADLPRVLASLRGAYDAVIIDTSPINVVTDATLLAPYCDGVIVVARAAVTSREALDFALEQLRHARVTIIGTVLNDIDHRRDEVYREAYQYNDSYLATKGA